MVCSIYAGLLTARTWSVLYMLICSLLAHGLLRAFLKQEAELLLVDYLDILEDVDPYTGA